MASGRPLEYEAVDLCQLTVDTVSDAHIAGPDHRWSVNVPDEPVMVSGDRLRLHQVLANLSSNARVHTPAGTRVNASLSCPYNGQVVLRVVATDETLEDFGLLMVGNARAVICPHRAHTVRAARGLGLAIVISVVEANNGTVEVHSIPGETTVAVKLPVIPLQQ